MSPAKLKAAIKQCKEMLFFNIIGESTSEYVSAPVLVLKPDGGWRFAIDYRKLNQLTKADGFCFPTLESIMAWLNESCVYSNIDLRWAFWQAFINPDDTHKTAFAIEGLGQ